MPKNAVSALLEDVGRQTRRIINKKPKSTKYEAVPRNVPTEPKSPGSAAHAGPKVAVDASTQPLAADGDRPKTSADWMPAMLRSRVVVALIAFNVSLLATVVTLWAISNRNSGLGNDDGSAGTFFASRFGPTILSVLFVICLSMLLDDIKRTESYARLSRPDGAPARLSILRRPGAWWDAVIDSFPDRRNHKAFSLTMFCSSIAYILGALALSPISSTLILSESVLLDDDATFAMLDVSPQMSMTLNPSDETFFRTTGSIVQNATTSAWITENYAIVPFWPASAGNIPLQSLLSPNTETWVANTTVLSASMACEPLTLIEVKFANYSELSYNGSTEESYEVPDINLSSLSGCKVTVSNYQDPNLLWVSSSNGTALNNTDTLSSSSRYVFHEGCGRNESIIHIMDPVISDPVDDTLNSDVRVRAFTCLTTYWMGEATVTALSNSSGSIVQIDKEQYLATRQEMPSTVLNSTELNDVCLTADWPSHLYTVGSENFTSQDTVGPGTLLAALNDFWPQDIYNGPLVQQARMIKQRFFGESLYRAFQSASPSPIESTGTVTRVQRRVVVVSTAALAATVVLALQIALLGAVWFASQASRRPLNLAADPTTAITTARMLADQKNTIVALRAGAALAPSETDKHLMRHRYKLIDGQLVYLGRIEDSDQTVNRKTKQRKRESTRKSAYPQVLQFWPVSMLMVVLVIVLAAVVTLFVLSETQGLYQTAFVYEAGLRLGSVQLGKFNPASIITTLVAVSIGLWWGSIDATMRRLQPFLSLAEGPVKGRAGGFLSYESSYLVGAAIKACRKRHWLLMFVCIGSCLTQIFTISMSALWSRQPGTVVQQSSIPRALELREISTMSTATQTFSQNQNVRGDALGALFSNMKVSWMYGALIQTALNGSSPPWTSEQWSFTPVDLSGIRDEELQSLGVNSTSNTAATNDTLRVTLGTTAVRARLECSRYDIPDPEWWLRKHDLRNESFWNVSTSPTYIDTGYELGCHYGGGDRPINEDFPSNLVIQGDPSAEYPCEVDSKTSFYSNENRLICCENITNDEVGTTSTGYWSWNENSQGANSSYHFSIKWLHGHAIEGYHHLDSSTPGDVHMMWKEPPSLIASNCTPIIESADSRVTVEAQTGRVLDFEILGEPQPHERAWSEAFETHTRDDINSTEGAYDYNVTTSYGVLFVQALMTASQLDYLNGRDYMDRMAGTESFQDRTFKIRIPGLNVDYMTYAMLNMADNDRQALFDETTFHSAADTTFSTLFQHYVSSNLSLTDGGWVYQRLDERLPADLPDVEDQSLVDPPASPRAGEQVAVDISRPVEVLQVSRVAAGLCITILLCLIIIAGLVAQASRRLEKLILRRIESIADVAVLVVQSDRLLNLVKDPRVTDEALTNDAALSMKLDWTKGPEGTYRWMIDLAADPDGRSRDHGDALQ